MQARKFTRTPTDAPISFAINGMIGEHQHYLKDTGQGGLCIKSLGCIKPGTQLSISVPFLDGIHYISGKVAWCLSLDNVQYLLGVEFEDIVTQSTIITKFLGGIIHLDENPQRDSL
ncbi:MAG: PilZ domain-containing protein [gamma proteobacterium symbiont of Lucinoma myriamae]|nr:PilZ domain-containing protein [gamma proteobacterium symbiont of Lucinoma myriamae]MCU7831334.1 PilZ domain-containing protein [gamma proteobacterium symbiont of Lucinoma myriamae]